MSVHDPLAPEDDAFVRTALRGLRIPQHHDDFWQVVQAELDLAQDALAEQELLVEPAVAPLERPPAAPAEEIDWNPAAAPVERGPRPVEEPHPARRAPLRAAPDPTEARPVEPAQRPARHLAEVPRPEPTRAPAPAPRPRPVRPAAAEPAAGPTGWAVADHPTSAVRPAAAPVRPRVRPVQVHVPAPDLDLEPEEGWPRRRPRQLVDPDLVDHDPAVLPEDMRRRSNAVLVAVAAAAAAIVLLAGLALVKQRSGGSEEPAQDPTEQPAPAPAG